MKRLKRFWPILLLLAAVASVVAFNLIAADAQSRARQESYPSTNYSRIENGLYLGGILSEAPPGVSVVLNVGETADPYKVEVHRWEPIPDLGPAPELAWLRSQVKFIDEQRKAGRTVYVHCRAGVNRSSTVVAAYLMWRDHLTRDEALEIIRGKRRRIMPFPAYQDYLSEWEKSLKDTTKQ
jgi:hypothetical protein